MTEMQRQFEEWATSEMLDVTKYINTDVYCISDIYHLWQAWQASRAALVVKLPDWDCYDTPRQALEACEDRLNDAGVSYE